MSAGRRVSTVRTLTVEIHARATDAGIAAAAQAVRDADAVADALVTLLRVVAVNEAQTMYPNVKITVTPEGKPDPWQPNEPSQPSAQPSAPRPLRP